MENQITRDQLQKLAQDMVAASSLTHLYGLNAFLKAKKTFEDALIEFEKQSRYAARLPAADIKIGDGPPKVPGFLKFD